MKTSMKFSSFLAEQENQLTENTDEMEVLVNGIGMMQVGQVRKKVAGMLQDLASKARDEQVDWKSVKWMLGHSALHAYIDTLTSLQEKE